MLSSIVDCYCPQPYATNPASTEDDVCPIICVTVRKSFEDRNAIIVGPFRFQPTKIVLSFTFTTFIFCCFAFGVHSIYRVVSIFEIFNSREELRP